MAAGSNNIVTDGLIGCWDAGNRRSYPGAGSTLIDLAGSNSATLNYDTEFADVNGGAIYLDGTDDNVTVPIIDGQNGFSFSIWLYFRVVPTDQYTTFSIYNGGGAEFMLYIMEVSRHATSYMFGIRGAGTGSTLTSTNKAYQPSSNLGKWVHYCATYNGGGATTTGNYKVYFNGQVTDTNLISDVGGAGNQDPMKWGQDAAGAGDLDGYMGHIAFYNRALSADEVSQNYEATKSRFLPRIPKEGLMGYWDAGDPLCYDGNAFGKYSATWNLIDLCSGTVGEFINGNVLPNFSLDNGGYWTFDGTDDGFWAGMGDSDDMYLQYSNANGITGIEWVNLASDGLNVFFWKNDMFQFRYDASSKLNMRSGNATSWSDSADLKSAADLLTTDGSAWACVAASANKSNDAREIWLNGERVANDTGSGMRWGTDNARMGVAGGWGAGTEVDGKVGMALLYSRALSAGEIKDFYNKTKARFGH